MHQHLLYYIVIAFYQKTNKTCGGSHLQHACTWPENHTHPHPQLSVEYRGTRLMVLIQRHHSFNWFIDRRHQPLNAFCWHPVNETTFFIGILTMHLNVKFFHISGIMVTVHMWPPPAGLSPGLVYGGISYSSDWSGRGPKTADWVARSGA